MLKGRKQSKGRMNRKQQGERTRIDGLFTPEKPVWFQKSGKVNPVWLSICEKERNQTTNLLERIANPLNLQKAYKQVKKNKGSEGTDGMTIEELGTWLKEHILNLETELLSGTYEPQTVRGVEIPKPKGGKRLLGIPTVKDRLVQQAINQILQPIYDPKFSENSFGFRPNKSAHQALARACKFVKSGKTRTVDLDLAKFFDEVNHQRLLWLLSRRIGDKRLLTLIAKILNTGILMDGMISHRLKGTPQGSPLSPLLSNIVLDELDQELERRGLNFVRYADDLQIFVGSQLSAERVMPSIIRFIEDRMKLKVNRDKSGIRKCYEVNFLGHSLLYGGKLGLSKSSEERLKEKIKTITRRNRGISFSQVLKELNNALQGWLIYFRQAQLKSKIEKIEGWIRRRLRCFKLKQCKRAIGIVRFLLKLGVEKSLCWRTALSGKGWWRLSASPAATIGMNNFWLIQQGYYSLKENYPKLFRSPI
jgi:RNA-directed DNA polymerase